jgi:hypothetical protein
MAQINFADLYYFINVNSYNNKDKLYRMLKLLPKMQDGFTYEEITYSYIEQYGQNNGTCGGTNIISKQFTKLLELFPLLFTIEIENITKESYIIHKKHFILNKDKYELVMQIVDDTCAEWKTIKPLFNQRTQLIIKAQKQLEKYS